MDEKHLEQADAITSALIDAGVAKARSRQKRPVDFEGFCTCGAEIPPERIADERYNCVDCQTALERRGKLYNVGS